MEDIKSTKTDKIDLQQDSSDVESISKSDDLSDKQKRNKNISESDSDGDIDSSILNSELKDRSILRKSFATLRNKKNKNKVETKKKKDVVEIESGVEMMEDMEPLPLSDNLLLNNEINKSIENLINKTVPNVDKISENCVVVTSVDKSKDENFYKNYFIIDELYKSRAIIFAMISMILTFVLNLPPFLQGVLTCLFTILLFNSIYNFIVNFITNSITGDSSKTINLTGVQKSLFKIPDYTNMPICELPPIEEHKSLKSYSGWMNEIQAYDPANFHISMTKSVYIKLDGSIIRISNTNSRILKRSMYNEKLIDKKLITFTRHRIYNLLNCRIEMCPKGLARKRHFGRKYPMQLIIANQNTTSNTVENKTTPDDLTNENVEQEINGTIDEFGILTYNNEMNGVGGGGNDDIDIGTTIMNSDVGSLQTNVKHEIVPCADEIRILLFARNDREKEDWYRRFYAASIGDINDQEFHLPDFVTITDDDIDALNIKEVEVSPFIFFLLFLRLVLVLYLFYRTSYRANNDREVVSLL